MFSSAPDSSSNPLHNDGRDGHIGRLFSFKPLFLSFHSVSLS